MAAKKKIVSVPEKADRVGAKTPADLRAYAKKLEGRAGEMLALAEAMRQLGLDSVRVDGNTKADRGLRLIDEFIDRIDVLLRLEQRRQGRERV